uniref:PPM-type phosphatase domain-containing protein n=1 Tax=Entomoneis paludosa TaxID=265537 RepID=A0A7S2YLI8_9STRA|mmetsp:Transcript_38162/g.79358  ORF Transcript_38162/g.79358 Transcript_38162/m.79358 type:complete len:459 (+) Transcript_38162:97-1473(+)
MITSLRQQELRILQLEKQRTIEKSSRWTGGSICVLLTLVSLWGVTQLWIHHQVVDHAAKVAKITSKKKAHGHHDGKVTYRYLRRTRSNNVTGDHLLQQDSLAFMREETYGMGFYPRPWNELQDELKLSHHQSLPEQFIARDFGMLTRQSNQHSFNQDRAGLIRPFVTPFSPQGTDSFLVLLLDGHGVEGHLLADYARQEIPRRLHQKLNATLSVAPQNIDAWIQQQLNDTFHEVNEEAPPTSALRGGCTASISLRLGSKLFLANVGDSRTVVVQYSKSADPHSHKPKVEITASTRLDKAHLPDEQARIERMGGKVHIPPQHPQQSRVIVYSVAAIPHEPIGLAMSRSLGDWEWKPDGVIAEPLVQVIQLPEHSQQQQENHEIGTFLLAASDGVWDSRVRLEFFAERFGSILFSHGEQSANSMEAIMGFWSKLQTLFVEIAPTNPKWYRDDMTAIVVKL